MEKSNIDPDICDDGDLKEKALSPEELAMKKKKEREENKAKDLSNKLSIFAAAAKGGIMNKKPKVVDKMIDIMLRTIPLQPLPLTPMEQKAKPSSEEYQRFNNLAKRKAGKIALPPLEEMDELDRLKS